MKVKVLINGLPNIEIIGVSKRDVEAPGMLGIEKPPTKHEILQALLSAAQHLNNEIMEESKQLI